MNLRPAAIEDAAALAAIYGHAVMHGTGTFEETPPSPAEMAHRLKAVQTRGMPWLVAELDGAVAGFAYAGPYRLRSAYRYTVEDSVYIAPQTRRRGVGRALLEQVIAECASLGLRQMVAVIGDSANAGSQALHRALGFSAAGTLPAVGFKHGRWLDVVLMQRPLNTGSETPPDNAGLAP